MTQYNQLFDSDIEGRKQTRSIISKLILITWAAFLIIILSGLYYADWMLIIITLTSSLLLLVPLWLLKRDYLNMGGFIVVVILLINLTAIASIGQGIHDVAIMAYPTIIIISSLALNQLGFRMCIMLTLISVCWLVFGEANGLYIAKEYQLPNIFDLMVIISILFAATLAVSLLTADIRRNLTHSRSEIIYRMQMENMLREKEVQYQNLADTGTALIWTSGINKLCNYFNLPWLKFTGRTLEQEMGNGWADGVHPDDFNRCLETYVAAFDKQEAFDMEYRLLNADGEYRWIKDLGTPNYNSNKEFIGYIGHCFDITEHKRLEDLLRFQSTHDVMTGIYNRNFFEAELERHECCRDYPISIIVADVDELKKVNDTLGHTAGDELLKQTASLLSSVFRESDIFARIGGDEFAALLPVTDEASVERIVSRIIERLYEHNAMYPDFPLQLSLGSATTETNNLARTYTLADHRMYEDKAAHRRLFMNIGEYKQTKIAMNEGEIDFKSFFTSSHAVMLIIDPDNGAIIDANPAACDFYGWNYDKLITKNIDAINTLSVEEIHSELKLATSDSHNHFFFKHRLADGTIRDVEVFSGSMVQNGKTFICAVIHDITNKKNAEASLREAQQIYESIFRLSPEAIILTTESEGRYLAVSDAHERLTGYRSDEVIGRTSIELSIWNSANDRQAVIQKVRESGSIHNLELSFTRRSGELFYTLLSSTRVKLGNEWCMISILTDNNERKRAENALLESETRYRFITENSADVIFTMNLETLKFTYASPLVQKMLGYTSEEILNYSMTEVLAPESATKIGQLLEQRIRACQEGDTEAFVVTNLVELLRKDGNVIPAELVTTLVVNNQGLPRQLVGVSRDITDRKKADKALRESQALISTIVDNTSDMIWSVDPKSFGLMTFNRSLSEYFHERGIVISMGMRPEELFQTEDFIYIWKEFYQKALTIGSYSIEYLTYTRKRNLFLTFNVLKQDDKVFGISVFGRDITERKQSEVTLIENEARFREVLENSLDASYKRNLKTNTYDYFSPVFEQISGYTIDEFINLPLEIVIELIHPDDRARGDSVIGEALFGADGMSYQWDYRFRRKDGKYRWLNDRFTIKRDAQGQPCSWIGSVSDITDRKQREKELQAIAILSAALRRAPSRAEILTVLVEQLSHLLNCNTISAEIIDPITNEAVVEAAFGSWESVIGYRQPFGTGMNAIINETRQPYHNNHITDKIKVGVPNYLMNNIHAGAGAPLIAHDQLIGYLWMGRSTEIDDSEVRLLSAVADIAANALHRAILYEQTQKDAANLKLAYDTTLEGWVHALELRDHETEGHTRRVVQMTVDLANELSIPVSELENVRRGALLHDIGKMGIPDSVLLKTGALNDSEWEIMRQHPMYGYRFLEPIEYLRPVIDIPFYHHEKWDGSGYPSSLKGEQIPFFARIFAIVDVWDALRSDRPYRKAWTDEMARNYIIGQSGIHFDPMVVQGFLKMLDKKLYRLDNNRFGM